MTSKPITPIPDIMSAPATLAFANLPEDVQIRHQSRQAELEFACAMSDFIARSVQQYPQLCDELLAQDKTPSVIDSNELTQALLTCDDEATGFSMLRQFRHRHMTLISYRDLCLGQDITESLIQVSDLADCLIQSAYDWLYRCFAQRYGTPMANGRRQPMHILGMGKLGGRELNFSSDIDLIFCFPEQGYTEGATRAIENQKFFTRLGQKLIASLHQITEHGQVFRVDMRLRPLGDSGPLVIHFAAFEDYYQNHGRQWERYAFVKARIINPDSYYAPLLARVITPFVFRRYLDYTAIDSLRDMKRMIKQEVRRRGLHDNIKLGAGGIREAEFIVQSFQLIRGGKLDVLQNPSFIHTLNILQSEGIISSDDFHTIQDSYLLLRKVEHCLQQFDDKQTQCLPYCERNKARLAEALGGTDYDVVYQRITHAMTEIRTQFDQLIGEESPVDEEQAWQHWIDLWRLDFVPEDWQLMVSDELNEQLQASLLAAIEQAHCDSRKKVVGERGAMLTEQLFPIMIAEVLNTPSATPVRLLDGIITVLMSVCGRTAYLDLLLEHQAARQQLIFLCNASPFIATQMGKFPMLLDELINPALLYQPIVNSEYKQLLHLFMLRVDADDLEWQMESLRQFKLSQQLKLAAMDVSGGISVMQVSDHLTDLADALLSFCIDAAWQQMVEKYGAPVGTSCENKGLLVVAYGKFGGIELAYESDLDLVFLHDCSVNQHTTGCRQIENGKFYQRLVQRVVHLLHTVTHSGKLYEVDLRLRPQGGSGLLIGHINGFQHYQQHDAWTWEHQALSRSRCVYGNNQFIDKFLAVRHDILCQPRDNKALALEVTNMRAKMAQHVHTENSKKTAIKHSKGGIVDIEFLTQFWLLRHSQQYPQLTLWSDNVRTLQLLAEIGIISHKQQQQLTDAYLWYRHQAHQLSLNPHAIIDEDTRSKHQARVLAVWQDYLGVILH